MNLGRLCQIILKSDKEISGYGQLAQHSIFAYHIVRQTPLIQLPHCASLVLSFRNKVFTSSANVVWFHSFMFLNDSHCIYGKICRSWYAISCDCSLAFQFHLLIQPRNGAFLISLSEPSPVHP